MKCHRTICNNEVERRAGSIYCCPNCKNKDCVDKRRKELKQLAIVYKGGCCQICGYAACDAALHFHHLHSEEKSFGLSSRGITRAWHKVKNELDKCILLCANCHAEVHAGIKTIGL